LAIAKLYHENGACRRLADAGTAPVNALFSLASKLVFSPRKQLAPMQDKFPTQDKFIVTVSFYRYSLGSQHLADNI
jgi:hypothetical protein